MKLGCNDQLYMYVCMEWSTFLVELLHLSFTCCTRCTPCGLSGYVVGLFNKMSLDGLDLCEVIIQFAMRSHTP